MANEIQSTRTPSVSQLISAPSCRAKFANVIGEAKVDQFLASVVSVVSNNSQFENVEPYSVIRSAMSAAQCNLSVLPTIGQAAIVPYVLKGKKVAQFQVMTRGLVQLARRSGLVRRINACVIYADEFNGYDKIRGKLEPLKAHDPKVTEVAGYCAYADFINDGEQFEFWTKEECERHGRKYSRTYNNGPWADNFDAMAKKTVLKSLLNKWCPLDVSLPLYTAMKNDQAVFLDDSGNPYYLDNPNASEPIPEAERAERAALLARIHSNGTTDAELIKNIKGARAVDDVPTQYLRDLCEQEDF